MLPVPSHGSIPEPSSVSEGWGVGRRGGGMNGMSKMVLFPPLALARVSMALHPTAYLGLGGEEGE